MSVKNQAIFDKLQVSANEIRADKDIPAIERNLLAAILEGDHQTAVR